MKSSFVFLLCFGAIFAGHIPESRFNHQLSKEARLRHFVLANDADEVLKLLKSGANAVARYGDGHALIHLAALMGYPRITGILADHNADCNALNAEGLTPLLIAAQHGRTDVVDILLESRSCADANFQEAKSGKTATHIATELGLTSIVRSLIKNHADVNIKDKTGDTPLDLAIKKGYKTIAALLIPSSTNLNIDGWKSIIAKGRRWRL